LGIDSIEALDQNKAMESEIGRPITEKQVKPIRPLRDAANDLLRNEKSYANTSG
jgi:hypothetical protein